MNPRLRTRWNWRGVNGVPGGSRQYVEVGGAMDWGRWVARYREGRVFVTNGPLVEFKMNGLPPGSVVRPAKGGPFNAALIFFAARFLL